jgi:Microtubule-binding protein MIP-T3 CH-like domain
MECYCSLSACSALCTLCIPQADQPISAHKLLRVYSGEELDSAAIKEKGPKMAYLDKIIDCVGLCRGAAVDIRPAKVVAGLEPENTNVFLQVWRCSFAVQRTCAAAYMYTYMP